MEGGGHHWQGVSAACRPRSWRVKSPLGLRFGAEKPAGLRQSQRLSVRIFIDRRDNVLMVDRGSFVDQEGGGFAYVVHGNIAERTPGAARAPPASPRSRSSTDLAVGDQIVISGTDAFNGAQRVILSH